MTVHQLVNATLSAVLANTWSIELPPNPTWPAIVYDIDSEPEAGWCYAGGYSQHVVNVICLGITLEEVDALLPADGGGPVRAALEALQPQFLFEMDSGDSEYEASADVYARFLTVRLRTPRL